MAAQAGTFGLVFQRKVVEQGEQQHPEQVQFARQVEQEALHAAFGEQEHAEARRRERHCGGNP